MSRQPVFDFAQVYDGLKDFQRDTVDYVYRRLYTDADPTRRFLVADEVGLGKTLVARGLIARAVEHLTEVGVPRIDIVYICSNAEIARQNIRRLSLPGFEDFAFSTRLTMLPLQLPDLTRSRLNFVSFTPGTSLKMGNSPGRREERALLYLLLKKIWPDMVGTKKGPKRVFQGMVASLDTFERLVSRTRADFRKIDRRIIDHFRRQLDERDRSALQANEPALRERFAELTRWFAHDRTKRPQEHGRLRNLFIGELRRLLAQVCIDLLEPDLIILDEFQRFRDLLTGGTEAADLARSMFGYVDEHVDEEARVLLLSATPYRMYTLSEEADRDDHYADFLQTVEFLLDGDGHRFRADLDAMRTALMRTDGRAGDLVAAKDRVERRLSAVMTRTERLAVTPDRNGMLRHVQGGGSRLAKSDVAAAVALQRAAAMLDAGSMVEYWKSAPYYPNFWHEYKIGREFARSVDQRPDMAAAVRSHLSDGGGLIPWSDFEAFQSIDPGNARLRDLVHQTIERNAWQLIWLPPSLPYYRLGPPFDTREAAQLTKRLVFSAWTAVPRAVSTLLSYEAERQMMTGRPGPRPVNTPEGRERFTEPLRFPKTGSGMSAFAFVYPSPTLARYADPLRLAQELRAEGEEPTVEKILGRAADVLMRRLRPTFPEGGPIDERWYWAAPLVLDRDLPGQRAWLQGRRAVRAWVGDKAHRSSAGFELHLSTARQVTRGTDRLGCPPDDLADVLALLAVGGPGTAALRAIGRITRPRRSESTDLVHRDAAARIAWGFRSLFNTPEVATLVRSTQRHGPYWQRALRYAANGGLQAVLDEYMHVLREWLGILDADAEGAVATIAARVAEVVAMRSVDLHARDPLAPPGSDDRRMRARFALPFGQRHSEEEAETRRAGFVRAAFNSPFWPFVLTTTSIGQEGLDFHLYCHAVVHWNLPANPVDLEQREGRVHRYMGHAIRKNLAERHGPVAFDGSRNPWQAIVAAAVAARSPTDNDLVPYWVYRGPAQIERHIPALPLTREQARLPDLRRSLALYRLVFGQARQEDLVEFLAAQGIDGAARSELVEQLRMDLSPPALNSGSTIDESRRPGGP